MNNSLEEIERKALADMIKRRDLLNRAIADFEYELEHPLPPIDMDRVMTRVNASMEESRQAEERHYQKLLKDEKEGTLSPGGEAVLEHKKKEREF